MMAFRLTKIRYFTIRYSDNSPQLHFATVTFRHSYISPQFLFATDRSDQVRCRTGQMQDRTDAVQYEYMSDTVQDGCRTGLMQTKMDVRQVGCSTGWMQYRTAAEQVRCSTG